MKKVFSLAFLMALLSSTPGITDPRYDWPLEGALVTVVEGSYIPDYNSFKVDAAAGNFCPKGTWLIWPGQGSDTLAKQKNVEAVYSMLLAAMLSRSRVNLIGKNLSCTVGYIQLTAP